MKALIGIGSRLILTLVCTATPIVASDYYVDAFNGNDANSGLTPLASWRTITHAVEFVSATIPDPCTGNPNISNRIFIAPGTYDPAMGESYPLYLRPGMRLIGTQGSAVTVLQGPASLLLSYTPQLVDPTEERFAGTSGAEGLTLRGATQGLVLKHSPTFKDLVIEDMEEFGVRFAGTVAGGPRQIIAAHPKFDHVTITRSGVGMDVWGQQYGSVFPQLSDCTIEHSASFAIVVSKNSASLSLERCRIIDNGLGVQAQNTSVIEASDTLFAKNGGSAVLMTTAYGKRVEFKATNCTFADNVVGIWITQYPATSGPASSVALYNSVLSGNRHDLITSPIVSIIAEASSSADGSFVGRTGCLTANAGFVDPANGDYRLAFGSPLIDAGNPSFGDKADLLGRPHAIDGNLDTIALPDMGAIEFAPVYPHAVQPKDGILMLEVWGPSDQQAILYASDMPLLDTADPARLPETTRYGDCYLEADTYVAVDSIPTYAGMPTLVEIQLPPTDSFRRSVLSLQALMGSTAAPAGAAWSNPIEIPLPEL
jgi:hypothetical protein